MINSAPGTGTNSTTTRARAVASARTVPCARHRDVPGADMTRATMDGNEAAVSVAYRLNEVCCIYPITPSSPMAELADEWSSPHRPNVWGTVRRSWRCKARVARRGPARRVAVRRDDDDLHLVAGLPADDAGYVQDRRRTDLGGHPRRGEIDCGVGIVDFWRPFRRDGGSANGFALLVRRGRRRMTRH